MKSLTEQQIRLINQLIIRETGGALGVRDNNTLFSLEHLPSQTAFGTELYESMYLKAAVYARTIIMNHPFLDGNKRTGVACALTFLECNGYVFETQKGEIERFAVSIVTEHLELAAIAEWFETRSIRTDK